jgi:hypothetical protein
LILIYKITKIGDVVFKAMAVPRQKGHIKKRRKEGRRKED